MSASGLRRRESVRPIAFRLQRHRTPVGHEQDRRTTPTPVVSSCSKPLNVALERVADEGRTASRKRINPALPMDKTVMREAEQRIGACASIHDPCTERAAERPWRPIEAIAGCSGSSERETRKGRYTSGPSTYRRPSRRRSLQVRIMAMRIPAAGQAPWRDAGESDLDSQT
jgi:hypothetical protein